MKVIRYNKQGCTLYVNYADEYNVITQRAHVRACVSESVYYVLYTQTHIKIRCSYMQK